MVSKSTVSRETTLKKSKKRHAIALAARGGCGCLGQLWEVPGNHKGGQAAEGRLLGVGSEHWAYLIAETQDMCLVEIQDICLVETQDMCCVES